MQCFHDGLATAFGRIAEQERRWRILLLDRHPGAPPLLHAVMKTRPPEAARATTIHRIVLTRPRVLVNLEGAAAFAVALVLYWRLDGNWLLFIVLLLAPDLGMIGYLRNTRLGAAIYNLFHTESLPLVLAVAGLLSATPLLVWLSLIWLAHIGMDRALGFGLKYPTESKDTHLQHL